MKAMSPLDASFLHMETDVAHMHIGSTLIAEGPSSQRMMNTVTTNVPGPQIPLYCGGRRVLEVFPFVPLGNSVRIGVAIFSYDGGVFVGVTGDWDSAPDIDVLCDRIQSGLAELTQLALRNSATGRRAGGREKHRVG